VIFEAFAALAFPAAGFVAAVATRQILLDIALSQSNLLCVLGILRTGYFQAMKLYYSLNLDGEKET
jgi:hypothetical protein